jgi:hypothetical protein
MFFFGAQHGAEISVNPLRRHADRRVGPARDMGDRQERMILRSWGRFVVAKRRLTWAASPKRRSWKHYGDDCKLGGDYAIAFLKWCDGTSGWASLLGQMMTDMIGAGPAWKVERR